MKLFKFKTMTYGKHLIKYVAGILWNSINVDIKHTDNVNDFKRKIKNWQGCICKCGERLICIIRSVNLTLLHLSSRIFHLFICVLLHFSYYHTSWTKNTYTCFNCLYCLLCKIKIVLLYLIEGLDIDCSKSLPLQSLMVVW